MASPSLSLGTSQCRRNIAIRLSFLSIGVLGMLDRVRGIFGRMVGAVSGDEVTSCLSEVFIVISTFERNRAW